MTATTRYYALPCSFFTDPRTAALPPLAACILLRARAESLIGVLTRSPRMLGVAHGASVADVEAALAELVRRDLVAWWPDEELVVEVGGALRALGRAEKAAHAQVDSLPPFARSSAMRPPSPMEPPVAPAIASPIAPPMASPMASNAIRDTFTETFTHTHTGAGGEPRPERVADPVLDHPPTDPPPKPKRAPKPDPYAETVDRILAHLNAVRSEGVPGSRLTDTQWIAKLVRARPDAEAEARMVIEDMALEARRTGDWKWVSTTTPFHLEHFEGRLARAQARAAGPTPEAVAAKAFARSASSVDDTPLTADESRVWLEEARRTGKASDGHDAVRRFRLSSRRPADDKPIDWGHPS